MIFIRVRNIKTGEEKTILDDCPPEELKQWFRDNPDWEEAGGFEMDDREIYG